MSLAGSFQDASVKGRGREEMQKRDRLLSTNECMARTCHARGKGGKERNKEQGRMMKQSVNTSVMLD